MSISDNLTISQNTTIDGTGQQVTIDGGNNAPVIIVNPGGQARRWYTRPAAAS